MPPHNTFANCIIDEDNFICMKRVLALDISSVKHYVGYINLFSYIVFKLMGQLLVVMGNASRITGRPELIPDPLPVYTLAGAL